MRWHDLTVQLSEALIALSNVPCLFPKSPKSLYCYCPRIETVAKNGNKCSAFQNYDFLFELIVAEKNVCEVCYGTYTA